MITLTFIHPGAAGEAAGLAADLRLHSAAEYPGVYQRITQAIHAGQALVVLIDDRQAAAWLKVLAQRYGELRVRYTELTVHSLLAGRIGLPIPAEIGEAELRASGVLDLNIPASGQASFADYLLEVFFGGFLTRPHLVYRVNEILAAYEPQQWQAALQRPLVRKTFAERLRQLRSAYQQAGQKAALQLLDWLEQSPAVYLRNLAGLKLLANYPPALGERLYGPLYTELAGLGLDLRRAPVILQDQAAVVDEIRVHLRRKAPAPQEEPQAAGLLEDILEQVSGLLEIELEAVIELLRGGGIAVTPAVIQRVRRKFAALNDQPQAAQALAELDLLAPVRPPSSPQAGWDAAAWLRWAADEYLPYRFWLENTGQINEQVAELAGQYADWLYAHYNDLRYNSPHMAWRALLDLGEKLKSHPGPALVVMVDNFNAKFYPLLQRQLQQHGFFEQSFRYCISMLPTFTEVSKRSIIVGHYRPFPPQQSYAQAVEETWSKKLGKSAGYLPNISALRRVTARSHEVYFLNYLPVDFTLHEPDSHTGVAHAQAVQVYLATLAQDIRAFARRLGAERDLLVIFVSDHGSTRIPSGMVNVIDHSLYQKHATDEHHRYISITQEERLKLPDKVKFECYLFDAQEFDLPESYLAARGLYRFRPTDDSVYIHGGLTPEETIIPLAVYQPQAVAPRPLAIRLVKPEKIIAGARPDLVFEITNHNGYPVGPLEFEIVDSNLDAVPLELAEIQKLERATLRIKARCPNNADLSQTQLQVNLTFQFLGQVHEQSAAVPVRYDTLVKTRFNLDDL